MPFGASVKIGTIQRRLAWPLRKDDHLNREVTTFFFAKFVVKFPRKSSNKSRQILPHPQELPKTESSEKCCTTSSFSKCKNDWYKKNRCSYAIQRKNKYSLGVTLKAAPDFGAVRATNLAFWLTPIPEFSSRGNTASNMWYFWFGRTTVYCRQYVFGKVTIFSQPMVKEFSSLGKGYKSLKNLGK